MLFWHQGICEGIYSIHNISWNQIIRHNIHIFIWVTSSPGRSLLVLGPAVTGTLVVLGPEVRCPSGPGGPLVLLHRRGAAITVSHDPRPNSRDPWRCWRPDSSNTHATIPTVYFEQNLGKHTWFYQSTNAYLPGAYESTSYGPRPHFTNDIPTKLLVQGHLILLAVNFWSSYRYKFCVWHDSLCKICISEMAGTELHTSIDFELRMKKNLWNWSQVEVNDVFYRRLVGGWGYGEARDWWDRVKIWEKHTE